MQDQSAPIPKRNTARTITINVGAYAIALAIIWFLARNLSLGRLTHSLVDAQMILFIPAAVASMLFWFLGDTFSYARLFSYLHLPTRFLEMLPGTAAYEFFQIVNGVLAGVSLAWFIQSRKRISWLAAGGTLGFLTFIDLQVLATILLLSTLAAPRLLLGIPWYYPAAFFAFSAAFITFLTYGPSRLRVAEWVGGRSLLMIFRQAQAFDYLKLGLIRIILFVSQGFLLYLEMVAFGIHAPFTIVMAMLPIVQVAGALPISPSGLGTRQAAMVLCFHEFGSRAALLTVSLAHSGLQIVIRLIIGFIIGGTVIKRLYALRSSHALPAQN